MHILRMQDSARNVMGKCQLHGQWAFRRKETYEHYVFCTAHFCLQLSPESKRELQIKPFHIFSFKITNSLQKVHVFEDVWRIESSFCRLLLSPELLCASRCLCHPFTLALTLHEVRRKQIKTFSTMYVSQPSPASAKHLPRPQAHSPQSFDTGLAVFGFFGSLALIKT